MLRELGVDTRWAVIEPGRARVLPAHEAAAQPDPRLGRPAPLRRRSDALRSDERPARGRAPAAARRRRRARGARSAAARRRRARALVAPHHRDLALPHRHRRGSSADTRRLGLPRARPRSATTTHSSRRRNTCRRSWPARCRSSDPALDPLSHKNRELGIHKLVGILVDAKLVPEYGPGDRATLRAPRAARAGRRHAAARAPARGDRAPVSPDRAPGVALGSVERLAPAARRLRPAQANARAARAATPSASGACSCRHGSCWPAPTPRRSATTRKRRRSSPSSATRIRALEPALQADVALLALPMASLKENALIVNALQRCATLVVQNSLREGFGLTATEAMWKRCAVLASPACGLRQQIRHGVDGHLLTQRGGPGGDRRHARAAAHRAPHA